MDHQQSFKWAWLNQVIKSCGEEHDKWSRVVYADWRYWFSNKHFYRQNVSSYPSTLVTWQTLHTTIYDSSWLISSKTNQWSFFPPLHSPYTSTLSSMVLVSRLTPTGARFDSSSYSFFNLFWYAIILMTSRITWSPCATCTVAVLWTCACVKPADTRSSRDMGVDVETLTPGDGMRTVDCCI